MLSVKLDNYLRENPLHEVFDIDDNLEVKFTSWQIGTVQEQQYFAQIDERLAHLILLQPLDIIRKVAKLAMILKHEPHSSRLMQFNTLHEESPIFTIYGNHLYDYSNKFDVLNYFQMQNASHAISFTHYKGSEKIETFFRPERRIDPLRSLVKFVSKDSAKE